MSLAMSAEAMLQQPAPHHQTSELVGATQLQSRFSGAETIELQDHGYSM
jgi:hypothetical protein